PSRRVIAGARCVQECLKTSGCVVVAIGVAKERSTAGGRVEVAKVVKERLKTTRRIVVSGGVAKERTNTAGRVVVAGGVVNECISTVGCVLEPGGVALKRIDTAGRVEVANSVIQKGIPTSGRIIVASADIVECGLTYGCLIGATLVVTVIHRLVTDRRVVVASNERKCLEANGSVVVASQDAGTCSHSCVFHSVAHVHRLSTHGGVPGTTRVALKRL